MMKMKHQIMLKKYLILQKDMKNMKYKNNIIGGISVEVTKKDNLKIYT